jgi:regulator of replication initiation timing
MSMYPYNAHNMTMVIPVSKFADLHVKIKSMEEENARLKAEVERLTKAGDAMAAHIERNDERCYIVLPDGDIRICDWNAAKEGKPRA